MQGDPRRLVAVMLTDLVGYTALTQKDEPAALRLLEEHRGILRPLFERFRGREVKTIGDAFLVEFDSALDATQCAIEIQKALRASSHRPTGARIDLRIGIHVGDVVHRDGDVYGDAVNIVSRIEPLAEPGGICLSQTVYDQVRNKIDLPLHKLEPQALKNILFPVDVYAVDLPWARAAGLGEAWVGRTAEVAVLTRALEKSAKGSRSMVLITGEEGIGKTRLADEAVRLAREKGYQIVRGRCVRAELAAPYFPWSEAIREFLRASPNQLVYKLLGNYANEIVKLVPELAERLGPVSAPPPGDPDQARLRFYEGVTQFFANVAREGPVFLFLDDLQWADGPTVRLLAYAARSLKEHPVMIAAAFLTPEEGADGPLPELLRDARKEHLAETLTLQRLTNPQVGELVGQMFSETEISDEFRQLLFERTSGNPFYLTETLRSLVDEGMIYTTPEGRWERKEIAEIHVPKTVRDAIRERFNHLDKGVQDILRTASVLGTMFSADVLRALSGLDEETMIRYLESAVEAHVLREEPTAQRSLSLSFTDPHVRDVLYTEMLAIRRARYHRQAAEAIEALSKGRTSAVAADLAHHYREGHDAAKARDFSILAGDAARNLFAYEEALRQYQAAHELLSEVPDIGLEARVLEKLGACHFALGHPERSAPVWESAVRLYAQGKELLRAGALCVHLADLYRLHVWLFAAPTEKIDRTIALGREMLETAPPSSELALMYDMEAVWLVDQQRFDEARTLVNRAVALARQLGDKRAEMEMMDELGMVAPLEEKDRVFEYLEAKFAYFSAPSTYDATNITWAANNLASASWAIRGDAAKALEWAERGIAAARKMRSVGDERRLILLHQVPALIVTGDLARAEGAIAACRSATTAAGEAPDALFDRALARIDFLRGNLDAAAARLERFLSGQDVQGYASMRNNAIVLEGLGWVHLAAGKPDLAVREFRQVVDFVRREGRNALRAMNLVSASCGLGEALLASSEASGLLQEADHLRSQTHEIASALDQPVALAMDRLLEARILAARGRAPESIAAAESAVPFLRRAKNPFDLGRGLRFLGLLYRAQGSTEKAEASLHEALELFTQMGARLEAERTAKELGAPTARTSADSGLQPAG